tara:strand:+ start:463 stop:699 length:237 start_codon:yes stop_codon:yes gene_type:complete
MFGMKNKNMEKQYLKDLGFIKEALTYLKTRKVGGGKYKTLNNFKKLKFALQQIEQDILEDTTTADQKLIWQEIKKKGY